MRAHHRLWRLAKIGAPILVGLAPIGSLIVAASTPDALSMRFSTDWPISRD